MGLFDIFSTKSNSKIPPLLCPFCLNGSLTSGGTTKCSNKECGRVLPTQYVQDYHKAPPLFLPMMGLPNAGKSNFLMAATVAVLRGHEFWEHFDYFPLTDETDRFITHVEKGMRADVLPVPTDATAIKLAYMLELLGLPRWRNRTWVLRDVPGEHFKERKIHDNQVPFVIHANTAFLFFDFNGANEGAGNITEGANDDRAESEERSIDRVFRAYVIALREKGVDFSKEKNRKVVIVLTKADQLNLSPNLKEYLDTDEHWDMEQRKKSLTLGGEFLADEAMALYMLRLRRNSLELRNWVKLQPGGAALLNAERTNNVELQFCMISAIPCGVRFVDDPDPGKRGFKPRGKWQRPLRILDPFYWALELNSDPQFHSPL